MSVVWQLLPLAIIPEKFKLLKFTSDNLYVKNVRFPDISLIILAINFLMIIWLCISNLFNTMYLHIFTGEREFKTRFPRKP
jgi:hypothetical protein